MKQCKITLLRYYDFQYMFLNVKEKETPYLLIIFDSYLFPVMLPAYFPTLSVLILCQAVFCIFTPITVCHSLLGSSKQHYCTTIDTMPIGNL